MAGTNKNIPLFDDMVSFEELVEDYPGLTFVIFQERAESLGVPIIKKRVELPGKPMKKLMFFVSWDDVAKIEEAFLPYLENEPEDLVEEIEEEINDDLFDSDPEDQNDSFEALPKGRSVKTHDLIVDSSSTDIDYRPSHKLALELDIPQQTLDIWADREGIVYTAVRFPGRAPCVSYDAAQREMLREIVAKRRDQTAGPGIYSLGGIRKEFKIGVVKLARILKDLEIVPEKYYFGAVFGEGITSSEAKILRTFLKTQFPKRAPANVKSVYTWSRILNTSPGLLTDLAVGAGIGPIDYLFDGHVAKGLSSAEIKSIKQAYDPSIMRKLLPVSVTKAARANKMSGPTLIKLANGVGITPGTHRFGGAKTGKGFTPADLKAIQAGYDDFNLERPIDDTVEDLDEISTQERITRQDLEELLDGTPIKSAKRKLPNGEHADVLLHDQRKLLNSLYGDFVLAT